ncbi:hypothetical protein PVAP13_5KG516700 [Panicum virgatum]|uniref:Uncharacterized protein n=1 Tax=Panicum virgatum TaxID=38727 RepID=A0A8T0SU09_PANVG|nr:hypothetical protein PVAP13_5KG516700 [Panicum virgatum]
MINHNCYSNPYVLMMGLKVSKNSSRGFQMSKQGTAITQSRRYSAEPGRRHEHCLHLLGSVGSALSAARLAQSVERKAVNLVVVGLSPTVGDFSFVLYFTLSFLEDCTFSFAEDTSTVYMLLKVHQAVAISSPSSSVGRAQGS